MTLSLVARCDHCGQEREASEASGWFEVERWDDEDTDGPSHYCSARCLHDEITPDVEETLPDPIDDPKQLGVIQAEAFARMLAGDREGAWTGMVASLHRQEDWHSFGLSVLEGFAMVVRGFLERRGIDPAEFGEEQARTFALSVADADDTEDLETALQRYLDET